MTNIVRFSILAALPLMLAACATAKVADTAKDVALFPVKMVGKGIDAVTTSEEEMAEEAAEDARIDAEIRFQIALTRWADECNRAIAAGENCAPKPQASEFGLTE